MLLKVSDFKWNALNKKKIIIPGIERKSLILIRTKISASSLKIIDVLGSKSTQKSR